MAGLIASAYEVENFQLSGGEDWVRTERYDVAARAGREVSWPEIQEMVKALLADRFKLRVRLSKHARCQSLSSDVHAAMVEWDQTWG